MQIHQASRHRPPWRTKDKKIIGSSEALLVAPYARKKKKTLCFSRLTFIRRQYFVMPTDGAAAARIIYCLCERHDCRNPRDRNPPRIVGAETRGRYAARRMCFSHYFSRVSYKLRRYSFIRRDKVHVFSCNFKSETATVCERVARICNRTLLNVCINQL